MYIAGYTSLLSLLLGYEAMTPSVGMSKPDLRRRLEADLRLYGGGEIWVEMLEGKIKFQGKEYIFEFLCDCMHVQAVTDELLTLILSQCLPESRRAPVLCRVQSKLF